jgi:hypothetical protein
VFQQPLLEVFSSFKDEQAVQFLTGGSSKKWYWSQSEPDHLGVGPNVAWADLLWKTKLLPIFYGAKPNEKIDYLFVQQCDDLFFRWSNNEVFIR